MIDLTNIEPLNDPLILKILLIGLLGIIIILILAIVNLKRKINSLNLICSTDEKIRRVLKSTDDLLGKLPEDEIEAFVTSSDFDAYKEVVKPILDSEKEQTQRVPPPRPEQKQEAISKKPVAVKKARSRKKSIPKIKGKK